MTKITSSKHPSLAPVSNDKSCRKNALDQLDVFLNGPVLEYAFKRNHDFGRDRRDNTSCLSMWLTHRVLLEEEVIKTALKHHCYNDIEKFIHEVFWRTYFKGWLEHRPQVWTDYTQDLESLLDSFEENQLLGDSYHQAVTGNTHLDCMNAWVNELIETGYLHNHARMWFASIWIFTLKLPWQLGADFFLQNLHDGDAASNTLSWRWVAGLHTKGKHYIASQTNIEKFTNGRFSPKGLAKHPEPILEDEEYPAQCLHLPHQPELDQKYGMIITEENCHPVFNSEAKTPSVIFAVSAHPLNKHGLSAQSVIELRQKAINEAALKSQETFNCPIIHIDRADIADTIIEHCQLQRIKHLRTPYLTVGPIRDLVTSVLFKLDHADIKLHQVSNIYDKTVWPHASKGFFNLKKQIPNLINELKL